MEGKAGVADRFRWGRTGGNPIPIQFDNPLLYSHIFLITMPIQLDNPVPYTHIFCSQAAVAAFQHEDDV